MNKMQKRLFFISVAILFFIWGASLPHGNSADKNLQNASLGDFSQNLSINPFDVIDIEAKSFLVFGLDGEVIASKEKNLQWPLASLTKLMSAIIIEENILASTAIPISLDAIMQTGDDGFLAGELFDKDDLRDIMLVRSSNDAAYAFAEYIERDSFIEMMNKKSEELGMVESYFINASGLDISNSLSGAYGSAEDLMKLITYILNNYPDIFEATYNDELRVVSMQGNIHQYSNTNRVVNKIPGIIGGKTGFTDIAGGHVIVVADIGVNNPVGIIVLASSEDGRFEDMLKLYQVAREWFNNKRFTM